MAQTKVQLLQPDLGDVIDFDASTLFVDGADNRIGIRNTNPQYELDVTGTINATNFRGNISVGTIDDWIVHAGDSNTKFGFPAADTISFERGGAEALRITTANALLTAGVTAEPLYPHYVTARKIQAEIKGALDVGQTRHHGSLAVNCTNSNSFIGLVRSDNTQTDGTDIGVIGWTAFDGTDFHQAAAIMVEKGAGAGNDDQPGHMIFKTNSGTTSATERLRIASNGEIGIGNVSNPDTMLHILMSSNTAYSATAGVRQGMKIFNDSNVDNGYASIELASTDGDDYYGSTLLSSIATGTNYSNDFAIQTRHGGNYGERFRIKSDGKISIGDNTNLDSQLTVTQAQGDCIRLRSVVTNNAFKYGIIKQEPYNNNAVGLHIIAGKSDSSYSEVAIGGGVDSGYAATQIDFYTGATTTTATGTKRARINLTGQLLLGPGSLATTKATLAGSLDLSSGGISLCIGGDVNSTGRTNSTDKLNRITAPHYTNAEEPVMMASAHNISGNNTVSFGGGSSLCNAATQFKFYTAANTTTTSGTERLRIDSTGRLSLGEADFTASNDVHIKRANAGGDVALRITNNTNQNSGSTASIYFTTSPTQDFNTGYIKAVRDGGTLNFGYATNSPTVEMKVSTGQVGFNQTPDADGGLVQIRYNEVYTSGTTNLLTSASKAALRIRTSSDSSKSLYFGGIDESATPYLQVGNRGSGGATATYPLILQPYGNTVAIGGGGTIPSGNEKGLLDIYHTAPDSINSPHIRLWGPANQDARIEFGSAVNVGEGGYIMYNDNDEGLYIGSRMATYSEVNICTGMNDGSPTSNIRLRVDSVGRVTKPNTVAFHAIHDGNQSLSSGDTITTWNLTNTLRCHAQGGATISSGGVFTAPVTGVYVFHAQFLLSSVNGTGAIHIFWKKNNSTFTYFNSRTDGDTDFGYGNYLPVCGQTTMHLDANEDCRIGISFTGSGCGIYGTDGNWGFWDGYLLG